MEGDGRMNGSICLRRLGFVGSLDECGYGILGMLAGLDGLGVMKDGVIGVGVMKDVGGLVVGRIFVFGTVGVIWYGRLIGDGALILVDFGNVLGGLVKLVVVDFG